VKCILQDMELKISTNKKSRKVRNLYTDGSLKFFLCFQTSVYLKYNYNCMCPNCLCNSGELSISDCSFG
jgi:hypothetical protein